MYPTLGRSFPERVVAGLQAVDGSHLLALGLPALFAHMKPGLCLTSLCNLFERAELSTDLQTTLSIMAFLLLNRQVFLLMYPEGVRQSENVLDSPPKPTRHWCDVLQRSFQEYAGATPTSCQLSTPPPISGDALWFVAWALGLVPQAIQTTGGGIDRIDSELATKTDVACHMPVPCLLLPAYRLCQNSRRMECQGRQLRPRPGSMKRVHFVTHGILCPAVLVVAECTSCGHRYGPESIVAPACSGLETQGTAHLLSTSTVLRTSSSVYVDRFFGSQLLALVKESRISFAAFGRFMDQHLLNQPPSFKFTRAMAWRAFLETSARVVAAYRGRQFRIPAGGCSNEEFAKMAYDQLADDGRLATRHRCSSCTASSPDSMNWSVLEQPPPGDIAEEDQKVIEVLKTSFPARSVPRRLRVASYDACVMGPLICAVPDCGEALANYGGGHSFCARHAPDMSQKQGGVPKRSYAFAVVVWACGYIARCARLPFREGPNEIHHFLKATWPTIVDRPHVIATDKACLLTRWLALTSRTGLKSMWQTDWAPNTRFVLDPFHARNHPPSDYICQEWCIYRPMPADVRARINMMSAEQSNKIFAPYAYMAEHMPLASYDWLLFVVGYMHNKGFSSEQ